MTEKTKVKRTRKRVYEEPEAAPDSSVVTAAELEPEPVSQAAYVAKELTETVEACQSEASLMETEATGAKKSDASDESCYQKAVRLVRKWSAISAGAGLVPVPALDVAGLMMSQLQMLRSLSSLYGIPFDSQRSKTALAILASGLNTAYISGTSLKLIPFAGVVSLLAMPALNAASTFAVGKVFIQHFESGGTFLDFDPTKVKAYFEEQYRAGKLRVG